MTTNYDASQVGVPYVRAHRITINYPDNGQLPSVAIEQSLAVKMADGSVRKLEDLEPISSTLDLQNDAMDPIPLVNLEDGSALGADTSLAMVMLGVLAVVREKQLAVQ